MERRKRAMAAALAAAGVGLCVVLLLAVALPNRRQELLDAGAAAQGEAPMPVIPVPEWAPARRAKSWAPAAGHQAEWWPENEMPWDGPLAASMGSWLGVGNGEQALPPETRAVGLQALKDFGVPWASPVGPPQGYAGAEVLGGPYVPTEYTEDVLETENEKKLSTEQRYPYVKYYGQPNNFMHDNEIDIGFYNYEDDFGNNEYDSLPSSYVDFLNEFD